MAQQCPSCGGFDISSEIDRWHCLDCGNFFTFDDEPAEDGPAPESLSPGPNPEATPPPEPPTPTDHEELAAEAKTGSEGIDAPAQEAQVEMSPVVETPPEEAPSGEAVSEPAQEPAKE